MAPHNRETYMNCETDNSIIPNGAYNANIINILQERFVLLELANGLALLIDAAIIVQALREDAKDIDEWINKKSVNIYFLIHDGCIHIASINIFRQGETGTGLNFSQSPVFPFKIITCKLDLMEELI